MSWRSSCPGRQELEQLLLGQVAEDKAEEWERHFGQCDGCLRAARSLVDIPVERLAAFPSATLCVTCKQLEERR